MATATPRGITPKLADAPIWPATLKKAEDVPVKAAPTKAPDAPSKTTAPSIVNAKKAPVAVQTEKAPAPTATSGPAPAKVEKILATTTVTVIAAPAKVDKIAVAKAVKTSTVKAAPKPAAPKATKKAVMGRPPTFPDNFVIKLRVKGNPHRDNSTSLSTAERFDLYKPGMTVAQYLKAGGLRADLTLDRKANRIYVTAPEKK
jgi:hypothetical protein